jgi:aminoglycoside 6-adenylyltransferase
MQFADGNRIDLTLVHKGCLDDMKHDSLSLLLLDKDGLIPPLPAPTEKDYLPQPPTDKAFADCCNEFWWVCPYVAKGLWRGEITYAKTMMDKVTREQLMTMLVWAVGVQTGFKANTGLYGKWLQEHLEPGLWEMLMATYADADIDRTWEALEQMCRLFRITSRAVADHFGFDYPREEDDKVSAYLESIRSLPEDALLD